MQYLRARYYNPATGTFNRLDPFAGNMQDPQSLHKYLYVHGDPLLHVDPSGLFSLSSSLVNMTVTSMLTSTLGPILEPLAGKAATLLIPRPVLDFLRQPLSAFILGANVSAGASYFLSGGLVGGVEVLVSPNTGKAAVYTFAGISAGIGLSKGVYGGISARIGVVVGARQASDYKGPFLSMTVSFKDLPWSVRKALIMKLRDITLSSTRSLIQSGFLLWPNPPNTSVFLGRAMRMVAQLQKVSVTISWVPGAIYPVAATLEYDLLSVGKGSAGLVSFGRTWYELRTSDVKLA